jgi:hypothetical protein
MELFFANAFDNWIFELVILQKKQRKRQRPGDDDDEDLEDKPAPKYKGS